MPGARVIVLYPAPRDKSKFEREYAQDHVPMVNHQSRVAWPAEHF